MDQGPVPETTSAPQTPSYPKRGYPGTYDNLFMEAKGVIMFDAMDGFRAEIMKQITPFFSITHGLMMGSAYFPREIGNSLYNLSVDCYYNKKNFNASLDSTGRVGGRIVWPINKQYNFLFNILTSTMPGQDTATAELHYKGDDFHLTGKITNGNAFSMTYNQFVRKDLTVGMEAGYNPLHKGLDYSVAIRYVRDKMNMGCTMNSMKQLEAWYWMNASKRTKFVSKLTVDMKSRQSEMQVGCVYMFKSGKMNMSLTSSGHLQSYIEEYVTPTLLFTISVDHSVFMNASRIGFGTKVMMG